MRVGSFGVPLKPRFIRITHARSMSFKHDKSGSKNAITNMPTPQEASQSIEVKPTNRRAGMSIAERDAALMHAWRERGGGIATAEFEDGKLEEGYRRNVKANIFRYI
ncbi:hypothetical protein QCA50_005907 [Cerrena zonata]|uniref:Uncharacterized protein n=1 Tax=Cerrena zonata TaxID=2478898 RepID=A0AAW0GLK1_9APHY